MWVLFYVWQATGFAPFENVAVCPMTFLSQGKPDYPLLGQTFYPVKILEKSKSGKKKYFSGKEKHPKVR